jgi:hypothetical protein
MLEVLLLVHFDAIVRWLQGFVFDCPHFFLHGTLRDPNSTGSFKVSRVGAWLQSLHKLFYIVSL